MQSSERLEALGWVDQNSMALVCIGILIGLGELILSDPHEPIRGILPEILGGMGLMTGLAFVFTRKLALGLGKGLGWSIGAAVAIGLASPACFSALGWLAIKGQVAREFKRYGLQPRFVTGVPTSEIRARIEELREQEAKSV